MDSWISKNTFEFAFPERDRQSNFMQTVGRNKT